MRGRKQVAVLSVLLYPAFLKYDVISAEIGMPCFMSSVPSLGRAEVRCKDKKTAPTLSVRIKRGFFGLICPMVAGVNLELFEIIE